MSFNCPGKHVRNERHIMRQRGAGVRTVSVNFGFSIGLNSIPTSSDTTPATAEPPSKRRKTIVEHTAQVAENAETSNDGALRVKRTRKKLVLEDKYEQRTMTDKSDDSFVFGQNKRRKDKGGRARSTKAAPDPKALCGFEMKLATKSTEVKPINCHGISANLDDNVHVDMPLTESTTNQQARRKSSRTTRKRFDERNNSAQVQSRSISPDALVMSRPRIRISRQGSHVNDKVQETNADLPLKDKVAVSAGDLDSVSPPGVKRKRTAQEQTVEIMNLVDHRSTKVRASQRSSRARERASLSVRTTLDHRMETVEPARQTRRKKLVNVGEAKDVMTDVTMRLGVPGSDTTAAVQNHPQRQKRHTRFGVPCVQSRPDRLSELDSAAIALGGGSRAGRSTAAAASEGLYANPVSKQTHPKDLDADRDMPLAEIDANVARRTASPEKPGVLQTGTANAQQGAGDCISARVQPSHQTSCLQEKICRSRTPHQGCHPVVQRQDESSKVSSALDANNGADAQTHAQNSVLTRRADPAARYRRYGMNDDSRSLNSGPHSAAVPENRDRGANPSKLSRSTTSGATTTVQNPPGMAVDGEDDEDIDWLIKPVERADQRKALSRQSTTTGNKPTKTRMKMLDIDLDDLISNIASFAKQGGLEETPKLTSTSRSRVKRKV